jgi:hypothetical protein
MKRILQIGAALLGAAGLLCFALYFFRGGGGGKLTYDDPTVRKSLMTFAYKIYGDPSVENGRFFLSKIVFHNEGTGPVHDLSVSYQIPDYVPWTTPETQSELPAGQTLVSLYYPQLPSKVTELTNQTNATLETKIRWADKAGEMKEEILRSNVILRGVNEIEYCDLPENEVVTLSDQLSTGEFAVAMVTPNDPVVKEFVAEVTKRTGGTVAGASHGDPEEIAQIMKAIYDYMCETGMRYTSAEGVPAKIGDISTELQTVRMPRDVIITNQGLCVELAILWASVMEYLGCDTSIVFKEGHAFTVVYTAQGYIPIECTAITPKAIGKGWLKELGLSEDATVVPFEKAVLMAKTELDLLEKNNQPSKFYNVQHYQQQGMHAPELPHIDIDKIKNILAQRTEHTAASYAQNAGRAAGGTAGNNQVRAGYYRWVGANNSVAVDVPTSWARTENSAIPGIIFVAQDAQTSVGATVFSFPGVSNPAQAMELAQQGVSHGAGARIKVATHEYKGNSIVYTGNTVYRNGSTAEWVGWFVPSQSGVVGLFVGAAKGQFQHNQSIIQDIISTARIGPGGGQGNGQNEEQ